MRTIFFLVSALFLVGCGGADFTGTYSGSLINSVTCSDGSGQTYALTSPVKITDMGDELSIQMGGACDPLMADAAGESATLRMKACPPTSTNGVTAMVTFTSGSLSLKQNALTVSVTATTQMTGAIVGLCTGISSGTLTRP